MPKVKIDGDPIPPPVSASTPQSLHKSIIFAVTAVALAAIGGIILFAACHPDFWPALNQHTGNLIWALMGGTFLLSTAFGIASVVSYKKGIKTPPKTTKKQIKPKSSRPTRQPDPSKKTQQQPTVNLPANSAPAKPLYQPKGYLVVSWNIGSNHDYMVTRKGITNNSITSDENNQQLTTERRALAKECFTELGSTLCSPDIVLLQEVNKTFDALETSNTLTHCFGTNYECLNSPPSEGEKLDTAVAWNTQKFEKLHDDFAKSEFLDKGKIREWRDKIVVLRDRTTNKILIIASGHIRGFPLKAQNIKDQAQDGNKQLDSLSQKLESIQTNYSADITILGMDANTDSSDQAERLKILKSKIWTIDSSTNFTHANGKLDYFGIFVNAGMPAIINILSTPSKSQHTSSKNPSDHEMLVADIKFW